MIVGQLFILMASIAIMCVAVILWLMLLMRLWCDIRDRRWNEIVPTGWMILIPGTLAALMGIGAYTVAVAAVMALLS